MHKEAYKMFCKTVNNRSTPFLKVLHLFTSMHFAFITGQEKYDHKEVSMYHIQVIKERAHPRTEMVFQPGRAQKSEQARLLLNGSIDLTNKYQ